MKSLAINETDTDRGIESGPCTFSVQGICTDDVPLMNYNVMTWLQPRCNILEMGDIYCDMVMPTNLKACTITPVSTHECSRGYFCYFCMGWAVLKMIVQLLVPIAKHISSGFCYIVTVGFKKILTFHLLYTTKNKYAHARRAALFSLEVSMSRSAALPRAISTGQTTSGVHTQSHHGSKCRIIHDPQLLTHKSWISPMNS